MTSDQTTERDRAEEGGRWSPFQVVPTGGRPGRMRGPSTAEGIADRLRAVAFAERQARDAFLWAAASLPDASDELRRAWRALASAEDKHLGWLLGRLSALGGTAGDRPVADDLFRALTACGSAREFASLMARAEDRGRLAGEVLGQRLRATDAETADLFARIAAEEVEHVALARRFFPDDIA